MIADEYTGYIIIISKRDIIEEGIKPIYKIRIDYKWLKSREYLVAALHHMIDTRYLAGNWIRDDILRLLAFIYQKDQINDIIKINSEIVNPVYIIITTKEDYEENRDIYDRYDEVMLNSNIEFLSEQAIFRLEVEKERGKLRPH